MDRDLHRELATTVLLIVVCWSLVAITLAVDRDRARSEARLLRERCQCPIEAPP